MESSLNGSLSSLIASPLTSKPRPLVLRNHFSNVSNKQQEQKYLPAPRVRRTSEDSAAKLNTPHVKRKTRESSEDTKTNSTNETSKTTTIGSLVKISSDEGDNNTLTESKPKTKR